MAAAMAGYGLNDALIKLSSAHLELFQAVFLRGLVATCLIALLAWRMRALRVRVPPADRPVLALRITGEIGGTICFLTALFNMPIANATAILQSLPLAITLAAALFLGERVGWRRYSAVTVGFLGVLMIVRPGSDGFNAYSLWALASVAFIVLRDLATRRLSAAVPSLLVALVTAVSITALGGLVSAFGRWNPVAAVDIAVLAAAAAFLTLGYLCSIMTMRIGEISFSSPFRYTILIWAIILGIVVFGEVPSAWTLAGAAVVVGTGLYTFYRERRLGSTAGASMAPHRPLQPSPARYLRRHHSEGGDRR